MYTYEPKGVCSRKITFNVENDKIKDINFVGGCPGNLLGISHLIDGMDMESVIKKLKGIRCGNKETSCPDQLAKALEEFIKSK